MAGKCTQVALIGAMVFDDIVGQNQVLDFLEKVLKSGQISHAYLFVGPEGVGRRKTALALAAALNCAKGGCGHCSICRRTIRGVYPDLKLIQPEGNFITIEQIRELKGSIKLRSYEGHRKVIIIDEAGSMNAEASNALLKTLEEPQDEEVFILIAASVEELLPTISSRCQVVPFRRVPREAIIREMVDRRGIDQSQADKIARISGGTYSRALEMLEGGGWRLERREEILSLLKGISGSPVEEAFSVAGTLLSHAVEDQDNLLEVQKEEMEESLEVAMSPRHGAFIRNKLKKRHARQLSRKRSLGINDILDIISSWYRDLLVYQLTGQDSYLVNLDHRDEIRDMARRAKIERLTNVLKEIGKIRRMVEFYVNPGTAFEYLCLLLREV